MDEKTGVLCTFIAGLHAKTIKAVGSGWDVIRGNSPKCLDPGFSFSREKPEAIIHRLKSFISTPARKRSYTDYYFVSLDRQGWATLLRLVSTEHGAINAEVVMISVKDTGLMSVGYRFEHPESKGDKHGYFHVQPIRRSASDSELPPVPSWLPDHSPTFFIPAREWGDLLLYAIHACCGVSPIRELWTSKKLRGSTLLDQLAA